MRDREGKGKREKDKMRGRKGREEFNLPPFVPLDRFDQTISSATKAKCIENSIVRSVGLSVGRSFVRYIQRRAEATVGGGPFEIGIISVLAAPKGPKREDEGARASVNFLPRNALGFSAMACSKRARVERATLPALNFPRAGEALSSGRK